MEQITDKNFREFLEKKDGRVKALKIGSQTCPPCRRLDVVLPKITEQFPQIDFGKADLDQSLSIWKYFSIMSIPQIFFYKNGKQIAQIEGYDNSLDLIAFIKTEVLKA